MRKQISFLALTLFTLLLTGCDNELTVNLKQDGTITSYVLDEDGKGIEGATLAVNAFGEYTLVEETTNSSGATTPIKLIEGNYLCIASVEKDKFTYRDAKPVQVITDENIKVELRPFENVGTLSISLINYADSYGEGGNIKSLNVILTQSYPNNLEEGLANACLIEKVNSSGKVVFENIPVGYYYFMVYNDSKKWWESFWGLSAEKNKVRDYDLEFYYWSHYE